MRIFGNPTSRRLRRALGLALVVCLAQALHAAAFPEMVSFGDSLTDVGNVAGVTEAGVAPVIDGYYKETHFSDNVIWDEILADYWGLPARTPGRWKSTTQTPRPKGNVWAWGGSEAAKGTVQPTGVTQPIPNLLTEVKTYLEVNTPDPKTLYTIWSGADNLLVGDKFGPKAAVKAVKTIEASMRLLQLAGARHFLVFNMPKMGDTPDAQSGGRIDEIAGDIYSISFNTALRNTVRKLRRDRTFTARITVVDAYHELVQAVNSVKTTGTYTPSFFVPGPPVTITNVTGMALDVFQSTGTFPTNYLFWDDVHPTTQGHQIIAGLALKALHKRQRH